MNPDSHAKTKTIRHYSRAQKVAAATITTMCAMLIGLLLYSKNKTHVNNVEPEANVQSNSKEVAVKHTKQKAPKIITLNTPQKTEVVHEILEY